MTRLIFTRARKRAYGAAVIALLALLSLLMWPDAAWLQAAGKPTPGHENLQCSACHMAAPGELRQQLQASLRYFLGLRESPAPIGNADVANSACYACHERPTEHHPLSLMGELRFLDVQTEHGVHNCTGCHQEHHGVRVTASPTICSNCHSDDLVVNDPITPDHAALFASGKWDSCLRCHDFHGNHQMKTGDYNYPSTLEQGVASQDVLDHLGAGKSAYGPVLHPAKQGVSPK
jgi:hypothetical protein